jgi:uncharacterized protein (TIGR00730 family)
MKILKKFGRLLGKKKKIEKAPTISSVAIFGYANSKPEDKEFKECFAVCKLLAEAGYEVVDGGGPGIMLAATLGARAGGGKVTGVTLYPKDMKNFEGKAKDNILDEEIKTTSYVERTLTLMREGQVYVVFNGGTGTVSEFAMAWGLARLYFGHHKPLILYGKFWKKIIKAFQDNMHMRKEEGKVFKIVDSPEEVLEAIKQFEDEIARGEHDHHVRTTRKDSLNYMN